MSITKFYFHDAATSNTGTLPSGEQSASTPSVTASGGTTNRSMDGTIGVSQTSRALTSLGSTSAQPSLFGMFLSSPLAAQVIASGSWQLSMAAKEANADANLHLCACVYIWRPGTGAIVGTRIFDSPATTSGNVTEPGTSQIGVTDTAISGGTVTVLDGDILVCEIWHDSTAQGSTNARLETFYYDGITEGSATNCASFLLAPAPIFELGDPVVVQNLKLEGAYSGSFTNNVAAGNSLLMIVTGYTSSGATIGTSAPTFNSSPVTGATKLFEAQPTAFGASQVYLAMWLLPNVTGGAKPVGITITGNDGAGGSAVGLIVREIAGLGTAPVVDKNVSAVGTGTTPSSGSSGAITQTHELIAGGLVGFGITFTPVGSPWIDEEQFSAAFSLTGYQIAEASGGSFTYTKASGGSATWAAGVVTIAKTPSTVSGTGSVRIKKPGLSGVATAPLQGTGSVRMKKPTLSGLAAIKIFATGSVRMKKPGVSGAGQEKLLGTGSVRIKKPALSGTATAPLQGSGSVRIKKPALSGVAKAPLQGTGSVRVKKPALLGAGQEFLPATGSVRMKKMGILASGSVGITDIGSGSIAMHKMSLSASGKEIDAGTGSVRMKKMGLSATGNAPLLGSGSVRMHKASLSATGKGVDAGTGSVRMHKMSLSATGNAPLLGTGSVKMHKAGILASGAVGTFILGTGSVRMKKMGVSGSGQEKLLGSGSVRMHKPNIASLGAIIVRGSGSVRMHKVRLSGSGKEVDRATGSVRMHKMVLFGTTSNLATGSVAMHKMGIHGTAVGTSRASNLFIFTAV